MTDLKPYYQVKLTLLRCKTYFLHNPPKTEDEKKQNIRGWFQINMTLAYTTNIK